MNKSLKRQEVVATTIEVHKKYPPPRFWKCILARVEVVVMVVEADTRNKLH